MLPFNKKVLVKDIKTGDTFYHKGVLRTVEKTEILHPQCVNYSIKVTYIGGNFDVFVPPGFIINDKPQTTKEQKNLITQATGEDSKEVCGLFAIISFLLMIAIPFLTFVANL